MQITLYTPHPKQAEVHASPSRFKVVNFSRRAGKSTLAQNYIIHPAPYEFNKNEFPSWPVKGAMEEVGRYWIVAPTYVQAKSIYWRGLMFAKDFKNTTAIPRPLIAARNESELILTLVNGSTIELKGADNPDSLRGAGIKGIVLDEFAFWSDPDAWEYVLQPALSDTGGWAMFVSTPNGYNHFYEKAQYARGFTDDKLDYPRGRPYWSYHEATIYDNPNIPEEEKVRLETELDEDTFAQEYLAQFRKMRGLVYPEFSKDTHVFNPELSPPPLGGTWGMGIDPGTSNELAAVFVFIDHDNNWYVMDELYQRGLDTDKAARLLKQKMGSNYFSWRVADQAAAQFILDMNAIHNLGVTGQKKTRDAIPEGIRLIREMLKIQEGTGKPKLFVADHCRNFIREMESYRYPDKKEGRNEPEDPIKEADHLMDAIRYLKLATFMPQQAQGKKYKKHHDPITGRLLGYSEV